MKKIQLMSFVALAAVALSAACLAAGSHEELEELMEGNGKDYRAIEKGIAKGKFDGLQDKAQRIADQAVVVSKDFEPPIKKEEIEKFRAMAMDMNKEALTLKETLGTLDPIASKAQLKKLEQACSSCHKTFIPKKKKK